MKIYELALEVVASVYRLAEEVQPRDKDIASQMRRACASMVLNCAEGMYSQGGRKVSRYFDSMGSSRETMACLQVCVAAGCCLERRSMRISGVSTRSSRGSIACVTSGPRRRTLRRAVARQPA